MSSLQERIAARYQRIHEKRTFVLPVPGYADALAARYRPLPIEDTLRIYLRHQGGQISPDVEIDPDEIIAAAADMLVNACEELLELNGDGAHHSLGKKWTTGTIGELFPVAIPEGNPSVRTALIEALTSDGVMRHFNDYSAETTKIQVELDGAAVGESQAPTGATSSSSPPEPDSPESP